MKDSDSGARRGSVQRWRAVLEISLFALAATVLVTGMDLTTVGRVLARLPGPSVSRPETVRMPHPGASPRRAAAPKAPSAQAISPAASSTPAPARKPAPSRPATAAPRPSTLAEELAPPPSPPTEVTRIQHFYGLMDKGIALYNDGWYGPAVARFRQAASVLPNSPYAHLWWGRAALAAGRPEEARLPLERAIALAPGTEVARKAFLLLQQLNGNE